MSEAMSAPSPFLNVTNMRGVMESLEARMERRHFDAVDGNARTLVLQIMREIDEDPDYDGLPVADKNGIVLRASWGFINDLAEKRLSAVGDKGPDGLEASPQHEPLPVPERAMPVLPGTDKTVIAEPFAPFPDEPSPVTPAGTQAPADSVTREAMDRASANYVDKIVKEPWAPPPRPPDTTLYISIDGFDRDFDLYPDRFRFQYYCGNNVMNVTKITATSLQLPVTSGDVPMNVGSPYVLVSFAEFSANCDDGASDGIRKSFCKFIIDKIVGFPGSRQFAIMKPAGGGVREFTPPMHSLSRMTVSFTLPDGALVSNAQDAHRITSVNLSTDAAANWILETAQVWRTDFEPGDIVQIRGVQTASQLVNDFLNRETGHVVVAGGPFVEFLAQRSSLVIPRPTKIDSVTKLVTDDDDTQQALAGLASQAITPAARIVNVSMQASLSLVAVCAASTRHEAVV